MLDYRVCKDWEFPRISRAYTHQDTILYALSVGYGQSRDPEQDLPYVYEAGLKTIPTLACVLGSAGMWWSAPRTGVDWRAIVHGQQELRLLGELPVSGQVETTHEVVSISDKGIGRGAVAVVRRDLCDALTGSKLAESFSTTVLRNDGGFSARDGAADPSPDALTKPPERAVDMEVRLPVAANAALLYRLTGDANPLHVDPQAARASGFERPILHGLCTFGMAARAALICCPTANAHAMRRIAARFTAPVWPGETIRFAFWCDPADTGRLWFRAFVDARHQRVLDCGVVEFVNTGD
ncbi:MAG: MaoC/PaaZ C-terminal domain-containing protein [Luteibacter sp.]